MLSRVTIIIPAYNRADYINQTIDSVLNQSFQDFELIVVDDGSTDGTYEKIKAYGSQLTLLEHSGHENRGQSASINKALKVASGKYIIILDSDDFWELNKLQIQVDYLEANPEIGLVYTNGYGTDSHGEITYKYHSADHQEPNDPNAVLLDCYMALPVNAMVRKSVYDAVGFFNEEYRAAQDHDMLIRIAEKCRFDYLPDFLFYYRRHGDSISHTKLDVRWTTGFKILEAARQRYPYKASTIRKRKAVLNYRLGQVFIKQKRYIKAFSHFIKAGVLDPIRSVNVVIGKEAVN